MTILNFPMALSAAQIEAVVAFIPVFETIAPDNFARLGMAQKRLDGSVILGGLSYHPAVYDFEKACYENGLVQSFDWGAWSDEAKKYINDASLVESADLQTCIKLITTHLRAERFCEGHLESVLRSGHMNAVLRRLKRLGEESRPNA